MKNRYYVMAAFSLIGAGYLAGPSITGNNGAEASTNGGSTGTPVATSYNPPSSSRSGRAARAENILLSKDNTVVFRAVVGPISVAKAQQALLDLNNSLPSGKPIYLYLDTPGGDIAAGGLLIDTAKTLGRPVHTVSSFAASMGFAIVQQLNKRYVTPGGVLMAHRARVEGVGGQIPGEFFTAVGFIHKQVHKMETKNAARLGIDMPTYTALVRDEYWATGEEAVEQNAADAIANIKCDESLKGTSIETFQTFFGDVKVTFSACPAISAPLAVQFGSNVEAKDIKRYLSDYNLLRKALNGSK